MLKRLFIPLFLLMSNLILAQSNITINGKIVDLQSKEPIPYATVIIKSKTEDKIITGTSTQDNGTFQITTDNSEIIIEVSFIGYKKKIITDFLVDKNQIELGTISISEDSELLNEVIVTGEKSTVEFKLDKKVFNVGKDISSTGMGAAEVLNNVPSVNVDIEGQVSLRGNSGVQILINGKPSVLSDDGTNALGSISADMIDKIEVITNPSAKYEAGGTSGIINVILKKEEKKGLNGSISVNTGIPHNHSIGLSLNKRTEKLNLFTQIGGGRRSLPNYSESVNQNSLTNEKIETEGIGFRNETFFNITLGSDYYINQLNTITLSGNFALELEDQPSQTNFNFYKNDTLTSQWKREETTEAVNPKYQYDLQYKKEFKNNKEHVLMASTLGKFFGKDQQSEFINTSIEGNLSDANQNTETYFYQSDYIFKLDYTNPINDKITYEGGALYEINDVGNNYGVFNKINNQFVQDSSLSNNFEYDQKVLGIYSTGSYENKQWGIKAGLRLENTNLQTILTNTNEKNKQDYTNLFPSFHTSYKANGIVSFQAGYSRRIFRPRLWDLNPFFNIRNNYNIRRGNPKLEAEFADSYEITGIMTYEKFYINMSLYHLYTTNVIERVAISEGNITITTPLNIGIRNKTGLEINGKYSLNKWLNITGEFNYGFFSRNGTFNNQNFDFQGSQWSTKLTSKIKLPADIDLEITGNYQSNEKTVQGTQSGFALANIGARKKIWKGKALVNFSINDVFASRIQERFVYQNNTEIYTFSKRGRFFTLGFSYSFGKGEAISYSGRRH